MIKNLLLILCCSLSLPAFSQEDKKVAFGVKAGVNLSGMSGYDDVHTDNIAGLVAGAFVRINILGFYLQPEAVFTQKGANVNGTFTDVAGNAIDYERKQTEHAIDVPVLVGVKFLKVVRLNAGPVFHYHLGTTESVKVKNDAGSGIEPPPPSKWNTAGVGFQGGVGVDIWKINLDLRYDGNLSHIVKDPSVRSNVFQFTAGFLF